MEIDIKNFIEENIPELTDRLFPVFTTDVDGLSLVYNFSHIAGGHLKQSQLETKIIARDYDECKRIEEKLKKILDMEEDEPYKKHGNTIFHSAIAGGGTLFNDGCQMYEDTLYFTIKWR